MLGNGRLEAMCFDNQKRLCHIRGKLRKKVWINTSDIILIGLRDFQDEKADVILKYTADEARQLKSRGEIPENVNIMDTTQETGSDDIFFDDSDTNPEEQGNVAKENLNKHSNLNTNYMDDISDSDEDGTEEDE